MITSDKLTVNEAKFTARKTSVKGIYKDGNNERGIGLGDDQPAHPDLMEERKRLGGIVAKIIELDEVNAEKCVVDKISLNRKKGEFSIDLSLRIPELQPNPKIQVKRFNDITRQDAEPLFKEAAMYACNEKRAQSAIDFQ